MRNITGIIFTCFVLLCTGITMVWSNGPISPIPFYQNTSIDTGETKYPLDDRQDVLTKPSDNMNLKDPSNIQRSVEYDPSTQQYKLSERVGNQFYRSPQFMSFDEYQKYEAEKSKNNYWKQRSGASSLAQNSGIVPKLYVNNQVFDRVFGGSTVDIRPQGSAELIFSGKFNRNDNPLSTERQRSQNNFDFDEKIQLSVVGKVGDKLKITTNYNTETQFDFENQIKLEYTGYEDEIIRKIEAGNVSMPLSGTLITGSQSLFGIKTQLQFGRMAVTTVFSQQKSEQKEITVSNGAQTSEFRFSADNYDANRHFFLAQYFRNQYDKALSNPPIVNSPISINKIEVWVTNKNNSLERRDIIAFIDLGEYNKYSSKVNVPIGSSIYPSSRPDNQTTPPITASNDLITNLPPQFRKSNNSKINDYFGLSEGGRDNFAKLDGARKLTEKEYTLNPILGYISLNQSLNADEVLAVAYRYTVDGIEYQVGEFSSDVPANEDVPQGQQGEPQVLYTKLLKNETTKTRLPTWDLMMKNIYSMGAFQVNSKDFKLDILRLDEATGIEKQVITEGAANGKTYLNVLGLDKMNSVQSKSPDGIFDFLPGITIDPANGKIIFPKKEPFGRAQFNTIFDTLTEEKLITKYTFQELYDSTRYSAQQFPEKNKYIIKGSYESTSSSEFSLNAINIPQGSVVVTSGSQVLTEGTDYTVDYNIGRVKIINDGVLNSGSQIKIKLESNQLFGIQSKSLIGSRFDFKANEKLNLGGTVLRLSERPLTQKVNIGDEPIANTMYGFDGTYRTDSRLLTTLVDKIPFIETKEPSSVTVSAEFAQLIPGHPNALNTESSSKGTSYIDDFEGSKSSIDLKSPSNWFISGTPRMFTESQLTNDLSYGYNRARLAFYGIDPLFYSKSNSVTPAHIKNDKNQLSDHYVREVIEQEVFPNKQTTSGLPNNLQTFDLTFNPTLRGPYNFTTNNLNLDGTFNNPTKKWGGIFRRIESNDFEALNVEFIEFWVLDPFINDQNAVGGDLYFNLGNISEDILKDGRKSIENGLPPDGSPDKSDKTNWGRVPKQQAVTQSFDNDPASRKKQDVGLDGLATSDEKLFYDSAFLKPLSNVVSAAALQQAQEDPATDNYHYFRGSDLDGASASIIDRYSRVNGTESNSKTSEQSLEETGLETSSSTPVPDGEDINRDNTSSTSDEYFQYKVSLRPQDMVVGQNFIADKVSTTKKLVNGNTETVNWFQFKIPIEQFESKQGEIADFKSIRFIRMFMTNFSEQVTLRFARLQLVRGEWRKNDPEIAKLVEDGAGTGSADDNSEFDVTTVNIEENGSRIPIPYVLPPGVEREQNRENLRGNTKQNEQSLVLKVCNLKDGYARAAYRNTSYDFRTYKHLEMFIHAEGEDLDPALVGEITAFIRLGTDFNSNYYEYEIPMTITKPGVADPEQVWPASNKLDINFELLQNAKQERNNQKQSIIKPFTYPDGKNTVTVMGQPDLSKVKIIMIGIRNPYRGRETPLAPDNGEELCAEIWVNELRMSEFDEEGGWAAVGRVNAKLADFADVTVSGGYSSFGFGSIDKKVSERNKSANSQFDASSGIQLHKFLPEKSGLKVPMYISYSQEIKSPQYSPSSPDILLSKVIEQTPADQRDSIKDLSLDVTIRKGINFSNVHKEKTKANAKPHIYDVENLSATYAYTETFRRSYTVEHDLVRNYKASLGYAYSKTPKNIKPFDKKIKSKNLRLIKDFNFNYEPSALDFSIDLDRQFGETKLRSIDPFNPQPIDTTFDKSFRLTRNYGLRFDLTKSLKLDFNATNLSDIDEPYGHLDTKIKKDTVINNLKNGGRTTEYDHALKLSYNVPISKLPMLDWTSLNTSYGTTYRWQSESKATLNTDIKLGNTIQNTRVIQLSPQLNFTTLYNKSKLIRNLNNNTPIKKQDKPKPAFNNPLNPRPSLMDTSQNKPKVKKNPLGLRILARVITSLKTVSGTYSWSQGIVLPGYLPKSRILGQNPSFDAPGLGFAFGSQDTIINKAAENGWLTNDSLFRGQYISNEKTDINVKASFEPLPELRIDITGTRTESINNQFNYHYNLPGKPGEYDPYNETATGNFSISYNTWATAFVKEDEGTNNSPTFEEFESYRIIISKRLSAENKHSDGAIVDSTQFYEGYNKNSQEVIIPAFLAAYGGTDPNKIDLGLFPKIPKPNWRISYTGLSKIPFLAEYFSSITVNHSYRSTFSINSFNKLLKYHVDGEFGDPDHYNDQGNFYPEYEVTQITISEQISPLIGFDMRLKNNITLNIEYRKNRNLGLSLNSSQLTEQKDKQLVFGAGYRTQNLRLPFSFGNGQIVLKNTVTFKADFSIRDSKTFIYRIDLDGGTIQTGSINIGIKPSIDYALNDQFNIRIFYDKTINKPYTSNSYRTAFTSAGFSIRYTFGT